MALKSKKLDEVRSSIPIDIVTQEQIVRINLNVPKSTRARWKSEAARQGRPLAELIIDSVEAHLSK